MKNLPLPLHGTRGAFLAKPPPECKGENFPKPDISTQIEATEGPVLEISSGYFCRMPKL
jgi:hypothetical protein